MENNPKMAITPKGLKYLLAGLVVMVSGYILMTGGGSSDPEVFNYAMFDFRRLVAAPVVIIHRGCRHNEGFQKIMSGYGVV